MNILKIVYVGQLPKILQYGFNNIISKFLGFVLIILITKLFSVENVSDFFLFLNINSILVTVSLMGIPVLIIKELSGFYNQSYDFSKFLKFIIFCTCICMFLFIIFITIFSFFYSNLNYYFYICIASFLTILNTLCYNILICCNKIIFSQFFDNILKYLIIILLIFFYNKFFYIENIISIMIFYIISNILILVILVSKIFFILKKKKNNINYEINNNYKRHIRFIAFTGIATLATILNSKVDLLIIDKLLDKKFVAMYGICIQVSFLIYLFSVVFYHILSPKISHLVKKNKIKLLNIILDYYRFILLIFCGFIYLILFFSTDFLLTIFFSTQYLEISNAIKIISFGYFIMTPLYFSDLILNYQGSEKKVVLAVLFSFFINFLLNLLLIPIIGINGAAIALLVSHILLFSLYYYFNYRNFYIFKNLFYLIKYKKYRIIKKILSH